jgi:hypothetical protein
MMNSLVGNIAQKPAVLAGAGFELQSRVIDFKFFGKEHQ